MNSSQKFCSFLFILLIIAFFQNVITAQEDFETQPAENWLIEYGIGSEPRIYFRYDKYSKADTVKFRERLQLINNSNTQNEWEGIYGINSGLTSFSQFRWNSSIGFIEFHIDTCQPALEFINYGNIINTPEYIELISDKTSYSASKPMRYVKVKWGKEYYLVEESSLPAFAEKVVGIYVAPEDTENENYPTWHNFMIKGDNENSFEGLPEFPASYKKFQRSPIEAKIISVGKRIIEEGKILGRTIHGAETAFYRVTINAGKDKNVKEGMTFDIPELKEKIIITKVGQNTSTGLIARTLQDNKSDFCHDDEYNPITCPQIKPSLKVKTQIGNLLFF